MEALNRIGRNAAEHLPMLYTKRTGNQGTRKAEIALQAYVACRLRDLLPDRILEREPEVQFRRRPDIQVHGQTHDGGRIAVVIELNPLFSNAAVDHGAQPAIANRKCRMPAG